MAEFVSCQVSVKNIVRSQAVFGLALPVSFLSANNHLDVVIQYDENVMFESLHVVNLCFQQEMAVVSNGFQGVNHLLMNQTL